MSHTPAAVRRRRTLATGVAALLAGAATLATLPSAGAATPEQATSAGALAKYTYGHGHKLQQSGSDSWGLTADAVFALDSGQVSQTEAGRLTSNVADHIGDYIGSGEEHYAGPTAKALLLATVQKAPGNALGGVDLVAALKALENADTGRFSDQSQYGNYANVFTQSFAVIALHRAGQRLSTNAKAYLLKQQCPGGGFALDEADGGCTDDASADTDATAMGIQALLILPSSADRTDRLKRAGTFLTSRMTATGGVGGGGPTVNPNSNSTGLAANSLQNAGFTEQAALARGYLTRLRFGCTFPKALRGMVAYDKASYDALKAQGSAGAPDDQTLRATPQAVLGLAGTRYNSITKTGASTSTPALSCS